MRSWGSVYFHYVRKGCDRSDAAFRADQWEKRRRPEETSEIAQVERALKDADLLIDTLDPREVFTRSGIDVPAVQGQISAALVILRKHVTLGGDGSASLLDRLRP